MAERTKKKKRENHIKGLDSIEEPPETEQADDEWWNKASTFPTTSYGDESSSTTDRCAEAGYAWDQQVFGGCFPTPEEVLTHSTRRTSR